LSGGLAAGFSGLSRITPPHREAGWSVSVFFCFWREPEADLTVKEAEKQLIERALKDTNGNRTLAAKKIGMSRRTFHRKLHTYHLEGF